MRHPPASRRGPRGPLGRVLFLALFAWAHPVLRLPAASVPPPELRAELGRHREAIDALDAQIVVLLNERATHAVAIGTLKRVHTLEAYAPAREQQVLDRVASLNQGPLPTSALHAVYREIMSGSLALEDAPRVAYLGPAATFTHRAALARFGTSAHFVPHPSVPEVVADLAAGRATHAVVAFHNSTEGPVHPTLDALANPPPGVRVIAEVSLPIEHSLASRARSTKDIRRLFAHPQSRAQCRQWLREHLPQAEIVEVSSNARAAEQAATDRHAAALCGAFTATQYQLPVLVQGVQDAPDNTTRFLVLGRSSPPPTGRDRTLLVLETTGDPRPAEQTLAVLREHGIGVHAMHTRPLPGIPGGQRIYLDCQGHDATPDFAAALAQARGVAPSLRSLGGHPVP